MTGEEHYIEAQKLLGMFQGKSPEGCDLLVKRAQVHATLAGVYAHNRATTELTGLLHAMLDQIRELREATS